MPDAQAGRAGQCPRCKSPITIPPMASSVSRAVSEDLLAAPPPSADPDRAGVLQKNQGESTAAAPSDALDRRLLHLPPTGNAEGAQARPSDKDVLAKLKFKPAPEYTGERQLPWPIDILLYPVNPAGLINLAIIVGIPLFLTVLQQIVFLPFLGLMFLLAQLAVAIYAAWYWAECTYDSAQGGTRAPQLLDTSGYGDKWSRVSYLLAVYGVFILPALLYLLCTGRRDALLWILVAWGILFFPMGLLAMVMHDGIYALNPLLLLGSIRRTLVPYLGLLLLIATQVALFCVVLALAAREEYVTGLAALALLTGGYSSLVVAHVLGRFYWRYHERLNWDL
jgi:hypothetical protein